MKPRRNNPPSSMSNDFYPRSQSNKISSLVFEASAENFSSAPNSPVTCNTPLRRQIVAVHSKQNGNGSRRARPTVSRMLSDISTRSVHFEDEITSTCDVEDDDFDFTDQPGFVYRRRQSTI